MTRRRRVLLGLLPVLAFGSPAHGGTPARFEALFAGGARVQGESLQDWHARAAQPKLEGRALFDPGSPLVWLRDCTLQPGPLPGAFVETIGGDRLPGEVVGFRPAGAWNDQSLPAHLIVKTSTRWQLPEHPRPGEVRVIERFVRRVVWRRHFGSTDRYEPGTVYYRDGRSLKFRAARFADDSVRLLLQDGSRKATFGEIAELHLPRRDPWQAYYDELAALSPDLAARLLQVETTTGLAATASLARFEAREGSDGRGYDRWLHALQPAWSLDLLWIPCKTIWLYRSFAPQQVPLSRILPSQAIARNTLGGGWHWQANRNVQGGLLRSGGQFFGWGLGVHAFSELHFPLSTAVRSFRTRFGLDEVVAGGGCVRVRVYAGTTMQSPRYEGPLLIGSEKTLETGPIALPAPSAGSAALILQVDPAHEGRPPGADPLDVRDVLDWLEPELELDPVVLKAEVERRQAAQIAAWDGWQPTIDKDGAIRLANLWDTSGRDRGMFLPGVLAEKQPLTLRRTLTIEPQQQWLLLSASVYASYSDRPKLEVRCDGLPLAVQEFPPRAEPRSDLSLMAFPLWPMQGKPVTFELVQTPGDQRLPVWWREIRLAEGHPALRRVLEEPAEPVALDPDRKAAATWVDQGRFSGSRALMVTAGGRFRAAGFDPPLKIRSSPGWGEYRYLRFAVRKSGGGRAFVQFQTADEKDQPFGYDAGKGEPCFRLCRRKYADELADQWMVVTGDLAGDYGNRDVAAIFVGTPDGEHAIFDEIYLARAAEDFKLLPSPPEEQLFRPSRRKDISESVLSRVLPITVIVEVEGRTGTGILVGSEGHVLTAGHVVLKSGRPATVTFADGKRLKAATAGVDRANDCGLLKLAEKVERTGAVVREWEDSQDGYLYLGIAHPAAREGGQAPLTQIVPIRRKLLNLVWADWSPEGVLCGGPLVNWDGQVSGIHVQRSRCGGVLYVKGQNIRKNWDRMTRGEVWGPWLPGSGPTLGVELDSAPDGCRVCEVSPEGPTAATDLKVDDYLESIDGKPLATRLDVDRALAEKEPGDEVAVQVRRSGKSHPVKLRLLPRTP